MEVNEITPQDVPAIVAETPQAEVQVEVPTAQPEMVSMAEFTKLQETLRQQSEIIQKVQPIFDVLTANGQRDPRESLSEEHRLELEVHEASRSGDNHRLINAMQQRDAYYHKQAEDKYVAQVSGGFHNLTATLGLKDSNASEYVAAEGFYYGMIQRGASIEDAAAKAQEFLAARTPAVTQANRNAAANQAVAQAMQQQPATSPAGRGEGTTARDVYIALKPGDHPSLASMPLPPMSIDEVYARGRR